MTGATLVATMSDLTHEEIEAIQAHRRTQAAHIDDAIAEVESQARLAETAGDAKTVAQLTAKLPGLRIKRAQILNGERG